MEEAYKNYFKYEDKNKILSNIDYELKKYDYMFRKELPNDKNAHILELGCGYGKLLTYLKRSGYNSIISVDISDSAVQLAKVLNISDKIIIKDIKNFLSDCKENSYDIVFAIDVLEHFLLNEIIYISQNVYRILKKEGKFIIQIPNGESPFVEGIFYGDITHKTLLNQYSIKQLLQLCGFRGIISYPTYPLPKTLQFYLKRSINFFLKDITSGKIFSSNFLTIARK